MSTHSYRLATYAGVRGEPRAGLVVEGRMADAAPVVARILGRSLSADPVATLDILRQWDESHAALKQAAHGIRRGENAHPTQPLSDVRLLAPVLYPGTVFCAGANYRDHVAEMSKALNLPPEPDPHEIGLKPWHFIKPSAPCVRATGESIALPAYSKKVDWEAEIAIVIGRACRDVSVENAMRYVAGLTIVNDLSARDHLRREGVASDSPFRFDWVSQKAFDGALPMGPWICPLDEAPSLDAIGIKLWLNDELMQNSSSSNLIFSMAEQVAHLSTRLTLLPGDVIATGTPAGCGTARGRFLRDGDRVRIWVESVGELVNDFTTAA